MGNENKIEQQLGRLLEEAKELEESAVTLIYKSSTEEQSLRHRAQSLESSIRRLRTSVDSLLSSKQLDLKLAEKAWSFAIACLCFMYLREILHSHHLMWYWIRQSPILFTITFHFFDSVIFFFL